MGREDVPGRIPGIAEIVRADDRPPFISDCQTWPSSFCQRMSDLPSPLKSPVAHDVPGRIAGIAEIEGADDWPPFICDSQTWPSSFCQRMSDLPSPLKSPVATTCQAGFPALPRSSELMTWPPFSLRFPDMAVVVLPEEVGLAVAVEVARRHDMPGRIAGIAEIERVDDRARHSSAIPRHGRHRSARGCPTLPSPLKSPVVTTCQAGLPALPRSIELTTEAAVHSAIARHGRHRSARGCPTCRRR